MTNKTEKKPRQPDIKLKSGLFQLVGWLDKRVRKAPEGMEDYMQEQEYEVWNMCLSKGAKIDGKWKNDKMWFQLSQFGNLHQVISDLTDALKEFNEKRVKKEGK